MGVRFCGDNFIRCKGFLSMGFIKKNIGLVIYFLIGVFVYQSMSASLIDQGVPSEDASFQAMFQALFTIGFIMLIVKVVKKKREVKAEKEKLGIKLETNLIHFNGLPIPENTICQVISYNDKYEFMANGLTFNLQKDRITDVCIKTDVEIQKQINSSVGGAIGWGAAGGLATGGIGLVLGAMFGGRAKTHQLTTKTKYLIITYFKDEEVKLLCFVINKKMDPWSELNSMSILNEFNKNKIKSIKEKEVVEVKQIDL